MRRRVAGRPLRPSATRPQLAHRAPARALALAFAAAIASTATAILATAPAAAQRGSTEPAPARDAPARDVPGRAAQAEGRVERARLLFLEGSEHYAAGRLDEALARFLEAWRLVPGPELAYNVARTYERMGDARRGVEFYRHYLQQAPEDPDRADVERRIRELEAIDRRQREQIAAAPPSEDELTEEARTFFERGVAMFRRRRYDAALQAFTAAYGFTRLPEIVYNLAVVSERLGQTSDAVDYFREYARSLPPEHAERVLVERRIAELRARGD
jgi:tetratricopeptide (TPR) repeat protein